MPKITQIGEAGLSLIKGFESFVPHPYPDPATGGVPYTIGYGTTFYPDGRKVTMQDPNITEAQASALLRANLRQFEQSVDAFTRDDINQNQFDALVSFAYNVGAANLKVSTLLKKVNMNPNDLTIRTEFAKWNKGGGRVLPGLTRRRKAEADLYFSSSTNPVSGTQYTVQDGDTLYSIATRHKMTVEQLKAVNKLNDNTIHVGQTLALLS